MTDREKVIKALEYCSVSGDKRDCDMCPMGFEEGCALRLKRDALALLKAQEPIAPHDYDPVIYGHRYTCGNCHHTLWRNDNYCSQCGKAVKWE